MPGFRAPESLKLAATATSAFAAAVAVAAEAPVLSKASGRISRASSAGSRRRHGSGIMEIPKLCDRSTLAPTLNSDKQQVNAAEAASDLSLSQAELISYRREGFLIRPGIFNRSEVRAFQQAAERAAARAHEACAGGEG